MSEYTKGEWKISKHGTPEYAPQYGIHNGGMRDFCITKGKNAEANAERICHCVNNYDSLQTALKDAIDWLEYMDCTGYRLEKLKKVVE